jgi:hypothetical protein
MGCTAVLLRRRFYWGIGLRKRLVDAWELSVSKRLREIDATVIIEG